MRALALIDGEHYPDVVRDTLRELEHEVAGAVLVGGTEKVRGGEDYGVPLFDDLDDGLVATGAELVVDLSDEPVLDPPRRFRLAGRALAAGAAYVGADFRLDPVAFAPFELPSLAVIGSGKRVGKTAVAGHVARLVARTRDVIIVAMGRGGPREPAVVESPPVLGDLLARSRAGEHAASDYLEDATLGGVVTVGCRRCGGGLAGAPFATNLGAGARLAAERRPDLVVFEGSGAAVPPVAVGKRVLVAGAGQNPDAVAGYLGSYRLLISDLVVLVGCEEPGAAEPVRNAIADVSPELPVIGTVLRPRPVTSLAGKRVAYFTTAPERIHGLLREHLEREQGADVVLVSGALADRSALGAELDSDAARSADAFLVELKAAAIDVVAEAADRRGVEVVFAVNDVFRAAGEPDLDEHLVALADAVCERVPA